MTVEQLEKGQRIKEELEKVVSLEQSIKSLKTITIKGDRKFVLKSELSGEYSVALPEDISENLLSELQKYCLDNIKYLRQQFKNL